jgi:FHA domain
VSQQDNRHRSIPVPGLSADAAASTVRSTLGRRSDISLHEVGPGRFTIARTRRPRWATIACACTFWLGGLGFLFLLVTRTEAGEIQVLDGPRGCSVTLPPLLAGAAGEELAATLLGPVVRDTVGASIPAAASAADDGAFDTSVGDQLDDRTVARTDPPPLQSASVAGNAPVAVLRCDAGEVVVGLGAPTVIGRDPSPTEGSAAAVVPGDTASVSKSHLLVEFDGNVLMVEDLGSTNGTTLVTEAGQEQLDSGRRARLADGDHVVLGALRLVVDIRA